MWILLDLNVILLCSSIQISCDTDKVFTVSKSNIASRYWGNGKACSILFANVDHELVLISESPRGPLYCCENLKCNGRYSSASFSIVNIWNIDYVILSEGFVAKLCKPPLGVVFFIALRPPFVVEFLPSDKGQV